MNEIKGYTICGGCQMGRGTLNKGETIILLYLGSPGRTRLVTLLIELKKAIAAQQAQLQNGEQSSV